MKKYSRNSIIDFTSNVMFDEKSLLKRDRVWPKISIITPSFNQAKYLERTILSVLNQNYPNLEYIIIDGGSTDGSQEIIRKYEKYLSYWLTEKDNGQADAINKGLKIATGDNVAWLNSDDIYMPDALYKVANMFREKPDIDFIYGNEYAITQDDEIITERRATSGISIISKLGYLCGGVGFFQPATFWRSEILLKAGSLDLSLVQCLDNDLFARFELAGAKFGFLREYLAGFRIHPESKTVRYDDNLQNKEIFLVYQRYNRAKPKTIIQNNLVRLINYVLYFAQGDGIWLIKRLAGKYLFKQPYFEEIY